MDLGIQDVAELLNVSEETIRHWLSEKTIPYYRMDDQFRFNRAEIEDWLMEKTLDGKIGGEEDPSSKKPVTGSRQFSLYRALHRGSVWSLDIPMSKEEMIRWTMQQMAHTFDLDAIVLSELFLDRERMAPTALGSGIAVPHTRDFLLNRHFDVIEVVYPLVPIAYGALDGRPVHTLFFLFASEDGQHLHLLAKLAHLCSDEAARVFLQTKPSKEKLLEYVKSREKSTPSS
jgi:PTS system nitrogen regulatory IIA component